MNQQQQHYSLPNHHPHHLPHQPVGGHQQQQQQQQHHLHHPHQYPHQHQHHNHHSNNPYNNRPLTTHTTLGSPLPRNRSLSLGNAPAGAGGVNGNGGTNVVAHGGGGVAQAPYSARSVPVSPVTTTFQQQLQLHNNYHQQHLIPTMPGGVGVPSLQHLQGQQPGGQFPQLHQQQQILLPQGQQQPPPEPSEIQKAMEHAVAKERERTKQLEQEEMNYTAQQLKDVLRRERHRTGRICGELAAIRATNVKSQFEAEVMEEQRINSLVRRMDTLQQEKGRIIVELEREEEMVCSILFIIKSVFCVRVA